MERPPSSVEPKRTDAEPLGPISLGCAGDWVLPIAKSPEQDRNRHKIGWYGGRRTVAMRKGQDHTTRRPGRELGIDPDQMIA
jgi:hypothetical protein